MKKTYLSIVSLLTLSLLTSCSGNASSSSSLSSSLDGDQCVVNEYFVYWLNDDGTLINKDVVRSGTHPVHEEPTSKKTTRLGYHYEFTNWINQNGELYSDDYLMPNENIIFTSIYKEVINKYTVTWKDLDDSVIDTTLVEYDGFPTHQDAKKSADEVKQEEYFFNGWYYNESKVKLAEYHVTKDTTFKAGYDIYNLGGCSYSNDGEKEICHVQGIQNNYPLNKIIILNEFKGKPVTTIADSAFAMQDQKKLEFTIGDNIETFEADSFEYCDIRSISFGTNSHLKTICNSAFFAVTSLETFKAPSSLEKIEDLAFAYAPLKNVDFTDVNHVITLEEKPFFGVKLENLRIKVKNELLEEYKTRYDSLASNFIGQD